MEPSGVLNTENSNDFRPNGGKASLLGVARGFRAEIFKVDSFSL